MAIRSIRWSANTMILTLCITANLGGQCPPWVQKHDLMGRPATALALPAFERASTPDCSPHLPALIARVPLRGDCQWTSFHHQPEAQHHKSSAIHNYAGRLPHLSGVERTLTVRHAAAAARRWADTRPQIAELVADKGSLAALPQAACRL
jgi:hypothetical protein